MLWLAEHWKMKIRVMARKSDTSVYVKLGAASGLPGPGRGDEPGSQILKIYFGLRIKPQISPNQARLLKTFFNRPPPPIFSLGLELFAGG